MPLAYRGPAPSCLICLPISTSMEISGSCILRELRFIPFTTSVGNIYYLFLLGNSEYTMSDVGTINMLCLLYLHYTVTISKLVTSKNIPLRVRVQVGRS